MCNTIPFGPEFHEKRDGARLRRQMDRIRDYMLQQCTWQTLNYIVAEWKAGENGRPEFQWIVPKNE